MMIYVTAKPRILGSHKKVVHGFSLEIFIVLLIKDTDKRYLPQHEIFT